MLSCWVAYCVPTGILSRQKMLASLLLHGYSYPFSFGSTLCCIASAGRPQIFSSFFSSPPFVSAGFHFGFISRPRPRVYLSSPLSLSCPLVCTSTAHFEAPSVLRQSLQIPDAPSIVRASTPTCPQPPAIVNILERSLYGLSRRIDSASLVLVFHL